jgi:hypothetical protein
MSNQVSFESWLQKYEDLEKLEEKKKPTLSLAEGLALAIPLLLRSQQFRTLRSPVAVAI